MHELAISRPQKVFYSQGPPLTMALKMDLPASKSLGPASYKQQVHKYRSYFFLSDKYMISDDFIGGSECVRNSLGVVTR
jgi:hypothetical protein